MKSNSQATFQRLSRDHLSWFTQISHFKDSQRFLEHSQLSKNHPKVLLISPTSECTRVQFFTKQLLHTKIHCYTCTLWYIFHIHIFLEIHHFYPKMYFYLRMVEIGTVQFESMTAHLSTNTSTFARSPTYVCLITMAVHFYNRFLRAIAETMQVCLQPVTTAHCR